MYCSQNHDIFVVVLSTAILLAKSCPDSQSDDLQKTKMKMSLVHQVKPARSEVSIVSPLASRQRIHPGSAFAWKQGKNKQGRTGDWCLCCGSDSWPALHYPPADWPHPSFRTPVASPCRAQKERAVVLARARLGPLRTFLSLPGWKEWEFQSTRPKRREHKGIPACRLPAVWKTWRGCRASGGGWGEQRKWCCAWFVFLTSRGVHSLHLTPSERFTETLKLG